MKRSAKNSMPRPQRASPTIFALTLIFIVCLGIGFFLWLPFSGIFPFSESGADVVLDFPIEERHWVPDPIHGGCGTLYILARGSESDLGRHARNGWNLLRPPISDIRFRHTCCPAPCWTPPPNPNLILCSATLDRPPASPDARFEYEFVVSATASFIYYEQRTLPKRTP